MLRNYGNLNNAYGPNIVRLFDAILCEQCILCGTVNLLKLTTSKSTMEVVRLICIIKFPKYLGHNHLYSYAYCKGWFDYERTV